MNTLDHLPGPKGLPFVGNLFQVNKKNLQPSLEKWNSQFGPYFQFKLANRRLIVIADSEMTQSILKK